MHGHRSPRHAPMPADSQILPRAQRSAHHIIEKFLLHPFAVFLPTVICKWRYIIKHQPVFLCVEAGRSIRVARAPRRAIRINQFAKRSVIARLLLRPRPNKRQQPSRQRQCDIEKPAPTFSTSGVYVFQLQDHLRSPRELLGTGVEKRHSQLRIRYGDSLLFATGT